MAESMKSPAGNFDMSSMLEMFSQLMETKIKQLREDVKEDFNSKLSQMEEKITAIRENSEQTKNDLRRALNRNLSLDEDCTSDFNPPTKAELFRSIEDNLSSLVTGYLSFLKDSATQIYTDQWSSYLILFI